MEGSANEPLIKREQEVQARTGLTPREGQIPVTARLGALELVAGSRPARRVRLRSETACRVDRGNSGG